MADIVPRAVHKKALWVLSLLCPFHRCGHRRSSDVQETARRLHSSEALVDPGLKPGPRLLPSFWQHLPHRLFVRTIQKNKSRCRLGIPLIPRISQNGWCGGDTELMRSTATISQTWGREAAGQAALCVLPFGPRVFSIISSCLFCRKEMKLGEVAAISFLSALHPSLVRPGKGSQELI